MTIARHLSIAVAFALLVSGCTTGGGRSGATDVARSLQDSFNAVAESVIPSIVRVDVRTHTRPEQSTDGAPAEPDRFFWEGEGLGSGVIVHRDRSFYFVLTNDHVVATADSISVVLHDDTAFEAELYGRDPRRDLALLRFTSNRTIPVATIGDSDGVRVGDWVLAVGSPFGYQNTVTVGIVSALGRSGAQIGNISDFIQTDAAINQGNSGGALVNLDGKVVGINTWISSRSGFSAGIGFAIPMNNAVRSVDTMIRGEPIEYGWLGVSIRSVDQPVASALRLPVPRGALIQGVFPNSPAAEAGLRAGDVVTSINGVP
ncbi:MAG: PDZ domain-containing protein, partial [Spirochaetaceae bacterium]